jgi:thiol-disulfide isomerase/thioredoxin
MKGILAKVTIFLVGAAAVSCLTAVAQVSPMHGERTVAPGLPVYLDFKALTRCSPRPNCIVTHIGGNPVFFCDHQVVKAPPAAEPCFSFTRTASEIRVIDLEGLKKIIQRDPKDVRPLLVNFWATWCDPCREEFPDLVKVDTDYRADRLNFVAVSLDDITDLKTAVPQFLKEMKATMPVVLLNVNDPEPAIKAVDATWDGQLPATFLYDKEGHVVFRHFGRIQPAELRSAIDKQLSSKP